MKISDRISRVPPSGTLRVAQAARQLRRDGHTILSLAEGEPDFDTPPFVIDAAHRAARAGETRYTDPAGTLHLRRAVAGAFELMIGAPCHADHIIIGSGAKQLIFNALMVTLDAGDEVVIPAPYWVSYPDMVRIADGCPIILPCHADADFKLTAAALAEAMSSATRWLILNSPGNPTGAVYSKTELQQLGEVLRSYPDAGVMCDDIYASILFDGTQFSTMAAACPDLANRVLTVNGLSKSHAMTGWRLGYAHGPASLIQAMTKLQGQSTTNPCSISQAAALAALTGRQDFIKDWCAAYQRRRDLVTTLLTPIETLHLHPPKGAFYHFIGCAKLIGATDPDGRVMSNDVVICDYLLHHAGVALVPGSDFGYPDHLRLSLAKSDNDLKVACAALSKAISRLTLKSPA